MLHAATYWIYWGSALLAVGLPAFLLWLLVLPFLVLFWLITNRVIFQIIRVLFVGLAGLFLLASLARSSEVALMTFAAVSALVWLCFSEKRYQQFTALHPPFPRPPRIVGRIVRQLLPTSDSESPQNTEPAAQPVAEGPDLIAPETEAGAPIYFAKVAEVPPSYGASQQQREDGR